MTNVAVATYTAAVAAAAAADVDDVVDIVAAVDVAHIREMGYKWLVAEVSAGGLDVVLAAVLVLPKKLQPEHYSSS